MQVALISTDSEIWALGMRIISSVLRNAGHHTRIIIMTTGKESYSQAVFKEIKELVKESDIIGISCLSRGSDKAHQVISSLRPLHKLIAWGGLHATLNSEECLKSADLVCRGEGEGMILELMEKLETGKDWRDLPNVAWKNNGKMVMNPLRPLLNDLDILPFMDVAYTDEFHLTDKGFIKASNKSIQAESIVYNGSRGCANSCTYCTNSKLKELFRGKGNYLRKISISKYIEHAKILKNTFPKSSYFFFADEDFFARSADELKEFSVEYPKHVGIPFELCGSPPRITEEKMNLLVKAGLWRIRMGIESGSDRTKREIYNRHISNDTVIRACHIVKKYPQVVPYYFLIISNPYETKEDLIETIHFLSTLPSPFFMQVFNLIFFPGTVLYERAVNDGIIKGKKDSGHVLDFRAGFYYKEYAWKRKNLYLNGLLFFMEGKSTRHRLGLLPRFILNPLLYPKVMDFNDHNIAIIRFAIGIRFLALYLRKWGARNLKRIIGDPKSVYNLKYFIINKIKRNIFHLSA